MRTTSIDLALPDISLSFISRSNESLNTTTDLSSTFNGSLNLAISYSDRLSRSPRYVVMTANLLTTSSLVWSIVYEPSLLSTMIPSFIIISATDSHFLPFTVTDPLFMRSLTYDLSEPAVMPSLYLKLQSIILLPSLKKLYILDSSSTLFFTRDLFNAFAIALSDLPLIIRLASLRLFAPSKMAYISSSPALSKCLPGLMRLHIFVYI